MDYRQTYTLPDAVFGDAWLPEIRLHTTNETLLQTDLERLVIEWSKTSTTAAGTTFSMDSNGADPAIEITNATMGVARVIPEKFIFPSAGQWVGNCAFYFSGYDLPVSQLLIYVNVQDRHRKVRHAQAPNSCYMNAVTTDPIDIRLRVTLGGADGWSPLLAVVADGERLVQQVIDWTGGTGAKPAVNGYVGASGIVADIADAADIRGGTGVKGDKGDTGDKGDVGDKGDTGATGDTGSAVNAPFYSTEAEAIADGLVTGDWYSTPQVVTDLSFAVVGDDLILTETARITGLRVIQTVGEQV